MSEPAPADPTPARPTPAAPASADPFDGASVVLSGASSGIGRACARALAVRGARLVLVARSADRLEAVAGELGTSAVALPGDIADPAVCEAAVRTAREAFGRLDVVLPNAGIYLPGNLWEADPTALHEIVSTNVLGVLQLLRAALPLLVEQGSGQVLVTSSVSGHQVISWEPVYSATKHAVQALVHGVRRQLVGTGVRVGEIGPGVVLNELWGYAEGASVQDEVAAGRGITCEDVADAVIFMLTRPPHVVVRDLVLLPAAQDI
jgi:ribitol 2-dehydrogenase